MPISPTLWVRKMFIWGLIVGVLQRDSLENPIKQHNNPHSAQIPISGYFAQTTYS
jgi:hypothetical protein